MNDKIEPALTAEEWKAPHEEWGKRPTPEIVRELVDDLLKADRPVAAIAVLNMSLYRDPRRITRRDVVRCRDLIHGIEIEYAKGRTFEEFGIAGLLDEWERFASLLESLLPPER